MVILIIENQWICYRIFYSQVMKSIFAIFCKKICWSTLTIPQDWGLTVFTTLVKMWDGSQFLRVMVNQSSSLSLTHMFENKYKTWPKFCGWFMLYFWQLLAQSNSEIEFDHQWYIINFSIFPSWKYIFLRTREGLFSIAIVHGKGELIYLFTSRYLPWDKTTPIFSFL